MAGRSSSLKSATRFLRKHRNWPTLWLKKAPSQESSMQRQQDQAMRSLLKFASKEEGDDDPENPKLLSALIRSFAARRCDPTPKAYGFVLKTLSESSRFSHIPAVLGRLEAVEKFETPESIFVDLMKFLCDADRVQEAVHLFSSIPKFRCVPSVRSLNALLSALCSTQQVLHFVPEVLLKSQQMGIRVEDSTFRILIRALCRSGCIDHAVNLLRSVISDELTTDVKPCSSILSSLCEVEQIEFAVLGFLEETRKFGFCPGLVDYSNAIKYLVKMRRAKDALDALHRMKLDGIKPDIACYTVVLSGVIEEECYDRAEKVFDELLVLGLVPNISTYNVYISGLCKQNRFEEAIAMMGYMKELGCIPDETTYEIIHGALCRAGQLGRANQLRKEVRTKGVGQSSIPT